MRHLRLCIGLPVFSGEAYLAQAIELLLDQTFTDVRLTISENASTDATADIRQTYGRRDRRRLCAAVRRALTRAT